MIPVDPVWDYQPVRLAGTWVWEAPSEQVA